MSGALARDRRETKRGEPGEPVEVSKAVAAREPATATVRMPSRRGGLDIGTFRPESCLPIRCHIWPRWAEEVLHNVLGATNSPV